MTHTWDDRIEQFWATVGDTEPEVALTAMRALVDERPHGDPEALYEWASIHDSLGYGAEAIPLYRSALDGGLAGVRKPQAIIQLASSLRNVGEAEEAIALLCDLAADEVTGDSAQAFLALALRDAGRHDEALQTALTAFARTLPRYRRSVENYAKALTD